MKIKQKGITLPELAITVAVLALVCISVVKVNNQLTSLNKDSINSQLIDFDEMSILNRLAAKIKKCGDGLQGIPDPALGKTVLSATDDPSMDIMPELIFLSKDNPPIGLLGPEDEWTRQKASLVQGRDGILEETFETDNWLDIKSGEATPVASQFTKTTDGVRINLFGFTLLDSANPPRISNQDPNSSSAVLVTLQLKKGKTISKKEKIINLEGMLYGPR